jgi:predicted ATP-dependent endonuclease of OLD family
MKFLKFEIQNFKGIEKAEMNLKRGGGNVFTLIGLNESGKTTFLEAISFLMENSDKQAHKNLFGENFSFLDDTTKLIPLKSFANFNDKISVKAILSFDDNDKKILMKELKNKYPNNNFKFNDKEIIIEKCLKFENSAFKETNYYWTISIGMKTKGNSKKQDIIDSKTTEWQESIKLIKEQLIPNISYFPSFLFNFPKEIYLDSAQLQGQEKIINDYYIEILKDILNDTDSNADLKTHILDRLLKNTDNEVRMAGHLLNQMGESFSRAFLKRWNEIFKQPTDVNKSIIIGHGKTPKGIYLSFKLKDGADEYFISERSLGFRWFFSFLLFTELRSKRQNGKNVLFLLDEPASNLHASAQTEILKSFERTTANNNNSIIFSTHSHYLINPNWLEDAFICQNKSIDYGYEKMDVYDSSKANIYITPYRKFVNEHSDKTTFFQPVLDILEYRPCALEYIPNVIIMEGKTDNYIISYFREVIFESEKFGDFSIIPGIGGSTGLDGVLRLYLGWGKKFIIMLDGDKAGDDAYKNYKREYLLSDDQIYKLTDVNEDFIKIEKLVDKGDKDKYNLHKKGALDTFFKEKLSTREKLELSVITLNNFKSLLTFFSDKIEDKKNQL